MTNSNFNLEQIIQKVQHLEKNLSHLEKSWKSEIARRDVQNAVPVTGALEAPKLQKLNVPVSKLVEIYNDVPQVLASYAIEVNVTAESYRSKLAGEIFLEKSGNGNYWVIAQDSDNFWLVPHTNLRINIHKYKTLTSLFEFQGEQSEYTNTFILNKPAKVAMIPNGHQWKLEKLGVLDLSPTYRSAHMEAELIRLNEEDKRLLSLIEQTEQKFSQIQSDINNISREIGLLRSQMSENREAMLKLGKPPQGWFGKLLYQLVNWMRNS